VKIFSNSVGNRKINLNTKHCLWGDIYTIIKEETNPPLHSQSRELNNNINIL